jgi:hypothetical protein
MKKLTCSCEAGWRSPQFQVQITPLSWGLALGVSKRHAGIQVGPVAVAVWFGLPVFQYHAGVKTR